MKIAARWRAQAFKNGTMVLHFDSVDGTKDSYMFALSAAQHMSQTFREIWNTRNKSPGVEVRWQSVRYQGGYDPTQPGWEVGIAPEQNMLPILFRTPAGIELEWLLTKEQVAALISHLRTGLAMLDPPDSPPS